MNAECRSKQPGELDLRNLRGCLIYLREAATAKGGGEWLFLRARWRPCG